MKENVDAVVGYVKILPAIAVEIGGRGAHTEVAHLAARDARLFGHVGERAIAVVAIERVLDRSFGRVEIGWSTVNEIDIHPTVVIEVEEETAAAARFRKVSQFRAAVIVRPRNLAL